MKQHDSKNLVICSLAVCLFSLVAGCVFSHAGKKGSAASTEAKSSVEFINTVYFATNSSGIMPQTAKALNQDVIWLRENKKAVLVIEGHCDERGPESYNRELGDRRARNVKAYILSKGISEKQIGEVVSYGKDKPADPRHVASAWKWNRRVELVER